MKAPSSTTVNPWIRPFGHQSIYAHLGQIQHCSSTISCCSFAFSNLSMSIDGGIIVLSPHSVSTTTMLFSNIVLQAKHSKVLLMDSHTDKAIYTYGWVASARVNLFKKTNLRACRLRFQSIPLQARRSPQNSLCLLTSRW